MTDEMTLKPMPLWKAILFFGIPGFVMYIFVYVGFPFFKQQGIPLFWVFVSMVIVVGAILINLSSLFHRWEGSACSWESIRRRFRLYRMTGKDWLWTAGLILFSVIISFVLTSTPRWLASIPFFTPPDFIPAMMNPLVQQPSVPVEVMGITLQGNWWIIPVWIIMLFFNVFGEELWWRGYILPRQETVHGKWAWLIHGVLWTLFHFVWKWNLIMLLPQCLALSFVVQRTKNTWIGIIVHFIGNGMALIPMIIGIAG